MERKIVRILSTDIKGELGAERALRKIKGISFMFSRNACTALGIDGRRKIGAFSDDEIKRIESFIKNPAFPSWMLNRRKDFETGKDIHVVMSDLDFRKREDINALRKMRVYRGVRHEQGLPVRGQRTRSSFRTQRTVGVSKKKIQQAAKTAEQKK
jgi:small subunit ribosomal protein S13